jgi:phytoene dehydrogenase-like protein
MPADVVVVGGGIAGLAVAGHLSDAGLGVAVLEAGDRLGGRALDEQTDGFTLGTGAHLAHTSWPMLRQVADPMQLDLRGFAPGVRMHRGGQRLRFGAAPTRPQQAYTTLRTPLGSAADKARFSQLLYRLAANAPERTLDGPDHPCTDSFAERGFSPELVEQFLRPFLAAFAADEDLHTSVHGADWLLRMLVRGRFAIPADGIGALVRLLAGRLPAGAVRLGCRVVEVHADRVAVDGGASLRAAAVVVATDPLGALDLFPGLHEPRMRAVTTLWHTVPDPALPADGDRSSGVILDGEPGSPVARTVILSRAAPKLAPAGMALIATTVMGHDGKRLDSLDRAVLGRLADIHSADTAEWRTLKIQHVEHALVGMPAPHIFSRPVRLLDGLYVCGDHRDLPNIEGALHSARRAADAVLDDLGRVRRERRRYPDPWPASLR